MKPPRSAGIGQQQTALTVDDLVLDATDRRGDDRSAFHIGSVTVSPKPSTRLFCTTTVA